MTDPSPSREIDAKIKVLGDWRGRTLSRLRVLIREAHPDVVEDIKWRKPTNPAGVPVWSGGGAMICTGETYKDKVKLTFPHGASLPDPSRLFNASLAGAARRAIDLREDDAIDEQAFRSLICDAVDFNASK